MNMARITEEERDKALEWLRDSAREVAQAKANRIYMEEFRKVLKSVLMKEHVDKALAAQEREAYADPRYLVHVNGLKEAVFEESRLLFLRTAAEAKISAWQSQEANQRAINRSVG